MPSRIHSFVQNADDVNRTLGYSAIDNVLVN